MPKISVVMPVYNGEKYIDSTLKTLLDQTYKDWEAVIVDGGSTDSTITMLEEYAKEDARIHIYRSKCSSAYQAIWEGLKKIQGDFVYILCFSDGYLTNEWYAKCMEVMEADSQVSLVWGIPFDLYEDPNEPGKEIVRPHYIFGHFLQDDGKYEQTSLIKRILRKIRITDPSSIVRFVKKINRSNISAAGRMIQKKNEKPPIKQEWFRYWLETGTIFPDGNMCVARNVLLECLVPYKGGKDVGNWEQSFFNINAQGYLTQCIPIPANFGRLNGAQLSEVFSEYNDNNRIEYFKKLGELRKAVKKDPGQFTFRDRQGNHII